MTASQPTILQLAKQGNTRAIAALMNRYLQPKGIVARAVMSEDGCLEIRLDSPQELSQPVLVDFTRKGITKLNIAALDTVKLCAFQPGHTLPSWEEEISLHPSPNHLDAIQPELVLDPIVGSEPVSEPLSASVLETPSEPVLLDSTPVSERPVENPLPPRNEASPPSKIPETSRSGLQEQQGAMPLLSRNFKLILTMLGLAAVGFLSVVFLGRIFFGVREQPIQQSPVPQASETAAPTPAATSGAQASPTATAATSPVFDEALGLGRSAAVKTQTAATKAEWQAVVSDWQSAIQRLNEIPKDDPNYATAQQKIKDYQRNLGYAQQRANAAR
jgi:hypothetical protein